MITGKARVSEKGWVVIPKEIRDEMGINPGDEVRFFYWPPFVGRGNEVGFGTLRLLAHPANPVRALRGKYKGRPGDRPLTEDLLEEKRREIEREERKAEYWRHRPKRRKTS